MVHLQLSTIKSNKGNTFFTVDGKQYSHAKTLSSNVQFITHCNICIY